MSHNPIKFLLTTGSTGGHIFPILSVAQKLKQQNYDVHIVSSGSDLEKKVLTKAGFSFCTLRVGRLRKGVFFLERFFTFILLPYYLLRSFFIILRLKPDVVMGSGGAVSGPVLLSAWLLRCRTFIWELNAVPGFTNELLALFVDKIFIGFPSTKKFLPKEKCIEISFPVREGVRDKGSQKREVDGFLHLLVLGGSQGSQAINQAVMDMYDKEDMSIWKIRHQTGLKDFESIKSIYKDKMECQSFYDDIGECYQWADIVIARAGASTLAELSACGKAAVIIPLPSSPDQHQYKNALALYEKGAVKMIVEKNLSGAKLFETLLAIRGKAKAQLEENIKQFYDPSSVSTLIQYLEGRV